MGSPEASGSYRVNTRVYEKGIRIDISGTPYTPRAMDPTTTRDHEAIHAALGDVEHVTIIPGPGYLGLTRLRRGSITAALGPHAMGANGTGVDVDIARRMGHRGGLGTIQTEVVRKHAEVVEIGDELARTGSMSGEAVEAAKRRAETKRRFGTAATVEITTEEGEHQKINNIAISENGTVMVPNEWVMLPKPNAIKRRDLDLAA